MTYSLQYYDLVLAGIIVAIGLGGLIGTFTWIQMPSAILGLGAASIGLRPRDIRRRPDRRR
jgi:hypothetical protein